MSTFNLSTLLNKLFVVGVGAAAIFIKNPNSQQHAAQIITILEELLPHAEAAQAAATAPVPIKTAAVAAAMPAMGVDEGAFSPDQETTPIVDSPGDGGSETTPIVDHQ